MRKRLRKKLAKKWHKFKTVENGHLISGYVRGPLSITRKGRRVAPITCDPVPTAKPGDFADYDSLRIFHNSVLAEPFTFTEDPQMGSDGQYKGDNGRPIPWGSPGSKNP